MLADVTISSNCMLPIKKRPASIAKRHAERAAAQRREEKEAARRAARRQRRRDEAAAAAAGDESPLDGFSDEDGHGNDGDDDDEEDGDDEEDDASQPPLPPGPQTRREAVAMALAATDEYLLALDERFGALPEPRGLRGQQGVGQAKQVPAGAAERATRVVEKRAAIL